MRIALNIERLVLEGLHLNAAERQVLGTALESELGRLIEDHAPSALEQGYSAAALSVVNVEFNAPLDPAAAGTEIARAVYSGIGSIGTPVEEGWG